MRIAVTGAHGTGKTTLIEAFAETYPAYEHVQEPYWGAGAAGRAVRRWPDDRRSRGAVEAELRADPLGDVTNAIFDRCPFDFIAYLDVVSRKEGFEWSPDGKLLVQIEKAIATLDLIAFLPITSRTRSPSRSNCRSSALPLTAASNGFSMMMSLSCWLMASRDGSSCAVSHRPSARLDQLADRQDLRRA